MTLSSGQDFSFRLSYRFLFYLGVFKLPLCRSSAVCILADLRGLLEVNGVNQQRIGIVGRVLIAKAIGKRYVVLVENMRTLVMILCNSANMKVEHPV